MHDAGELSVPRPDAEPEELPDNFWDGAIIEEPRARRSVHLKVDEEVYAYFKGLGKGHLTRMQEVLRSYVRHQRGQR
jgi:uncharacterized protein (DUF4415 family)